MKFHEPVLVEEVKKHLNIKKGKKYIDATVGGGGHTEAILKAGGVVLGIDWDPEAVNYAKRHLRSVCPNAFYKIVRGNFTHLREIAQREDFGQVKGLLFDLGPSSHQLEEAQRGFSFQKDAPLDMRMSPDLAVTAADLLAVLSVKQLNELFNRFAQEKRARAIAQAFVRARQIKPIETTGQLAALVKKVYGGKEKVGGLHPATKTFLALRIAVNSELWNLKTVLPQTEELLEEGGRLVVISFHQSEDRIVKRFLKKKAEEGEFKILTKKPLEPKKEEVEKNPRSRSAKLRAAEKIK